MTSARPLIVRHEYGNAALDSRVSELIASVFVGEGYSHPDMVRVFAPEVLRERGITWIATVDDAIAGTVLLVDATSKFRQAAQPPEVELHLLAVSPAHRGAGVGAALVEALSAHARAAGVPRIVLSSQPTMKAAHALYVNAGFTRAEHRDWVRADKSFWVFEKKLDAAFPTSMD